MVVSTIPATEIGLRIRRTLRAIRGSLAQGGVQDEDEERDREEQPRRADQTAASDLARRRRWDGQMLEAARGRQPLVLPGPFMAQLRAADRPGEDHHVHRELARAQVAV